MSSPSPRELLRTVGGLPAAGERKQLSLVVWQRPCGLHSGGQLSVCPPAASRIFPLTGQVRCEPKGRAGEFPRTPLVSQRCRTNYNNRGSVGGGLCVSISTAQQNRCMNGDGLKLRCRAHTHTGPLFYTPNPDSNS